jgi:predicted RND superfamily exporter protein
MQFPERVAHFLAHRRRVVYGGIVASVAVCVTIVALFCRLDSEVLNLLPKEFDSVQTFKIFDREFSQARELTFALVDESGSGELEAFAEHFATLLRAEPWAERVLDRSPIETVEGAADIPAIAAPLLLNLDPPEFARATSALEPAAIAARLKKLRESMEADSPKAAMELEIDPLGIVGPALKPLAGSFGDEQTQALASPDGTLRLVMVITNQSDLGAHACQATMRQVDALRKRTLESWHGASRPEILVTGRTAYVGELSLKMRRDVVSTFGGSALTVAGIFYIGFGRLRPLISLMHVLLIACVIAVAAGVLIFRELNMITIGLCAILVGLGEDFGMMLYAFYQEERSHGKDHATAIAAALRHHGSGVFFGALTTSMAFISLLLSDCIGFEQLGVLIGIGILVVAMLMMTVFFVFLSRDPQPPRIDLVSAWGAWFVEKTIVWRRGIFLSSTVLLVALGIYALSPTGRLRFDANPKSLEPRTSEAGRATRTIQAKMPNAGEPLFVMIHARDRSEFQEQWTRADAAWSALVAQGKLRSVATPAQWAVSPQRAALNAAALGSGRIAAARAALTSALAEEGMSADSFAPAFSMLDTLERAAAGDLALLDWHRALRPESTWWFVLDHFFGNDPLVGIGYVTPVRKLDSSEAKEEVRKLLAVPGIDLHFAGWSFTLADLIPWAKSKVVQLTAVMVGLNVVVLLFLYRRLFPLLLLMVSLALSMLAMLATLKLCGVPLNLFNVLAFPLVLGVGVDYGIYVAIAMRAADVRRELKIIFKPVLLSGLTTVAGFGSLITAQNPALWSLGVVCSVGVAWCLFSTFFFVLPGYLWRGRA